MKTRTIIGLMSCIIALVLSIYITPSASAASAEEEVLQVEVNWIKAFNTMDSGLMSSLYWRSPKTTSFPPNDYLYQGWDAITTMLKEEFKYPAGTLVWSIHNPQVLMLSDNIALITAYNSVDSTDPVTLARTTNLLRITLVVQKIEGKWLIVHDNGALLINK